MLLECGSNELPYRISTSELITDRFLHWSLSDSCCHVVFNRSPKKKKISLLVSPCYHSNTGIFTPTCGPDCRKQLSSQLQGSVSAADSSSQTSNWELKPVFDTSSRNMLNSLVTQTALCSFSLGVIEISCSSAEHSHCSSNCVLQSVCIASNPPPPPPLLSHSPHSLTLSWPLPPSLPPSLTSPFPSTWNPAICFQMTGDASSGSCARSARS